MEKSQEPSHDYGYDLVHEETDPGQWISLGASTHDNADPDAQAKPTVELDGDYSYDEAHDL